MKRLILLPLALFFSLHAFTQSKTIEIASSTRDLDLLAAHLAAQDPLFYQKVDCLAEVGRPLIRILPPDTWAKELERIYWTIPDNCSASSLEPHRSQNPTARDYSKIYIYNTPDGGNIYSSEKPNDNIPYRVVPVNSQSKSRPETSVSRILHDLWMLRGYSCTIDCSGHEAGYAWAEENSIDNKADCDGRSQSFIEGCYAYVEENN